MIIEYYQEFSTDEIVYEEDAQDYVLDKLGITIEPKGDNGTFTQDQIQVIQDTVDWFFSGNWTKKIKREKEADVFEMIHESCYLEDRRGL